MLSTPHAPTRESDGGIGSTPCAEKNVWKSCRSESVHAERDRADRDPEDREGRGRLRREPEPFPRGGGPLHGNLSVYRSWVANGVRPGRVPSGGRRYAVRFTSVTLTGRVPSCTTCDAT